jgi:hypothetical protein
MMGASAVLVAVAGWALNLLTGVWVPLWGRHAPPHDVGEIIPPPWYPAVVEPETATRVMRRPQFDPPSGRPSP